MKLALMPFLESRLDRFSWNLNSPLLYFCYPMILSLGVVTINSVHLLNVRSNWEKTKTRWA